MDFSDPQILTSILNVFRNASVGGAMHLIPHARTMLVLLGIINICTTWTLYEGQLRISQVISEIMKISFFLFIIINWVELNGIIMNSFKIAGLVAAGFDSSHPPIDVTSPSSIFQVGFNIVKGLLAELSHIGFDIGGAFLLLGSVVLVIAAFFIIAFQLMITQIEFNIFAGIAVILMPFGAIRYTKFLFQRCISAVFAFGVKLMLMYFLVGITMHFVGNDPKEIVAKGAEFSKVLTAACSYLILGFLCWKIPNLAATMIQGMPSMDASGPMQQIGRTTSHVAVRGGAAIARGTLLASRYGAAKAQQAFNAAGVYVGSRGGGDIINTIMPYAKTMTGTTISRPSRNTFNQNLSDAISNASQTRPQSSDSNHLRKS